MFEYANFVVRNPAYVTKNARRQASVRRAMLDYKETNPSCEWCGRSKKMDVHHIEPVSVAPEKADDPKNMATLCKKPACHQVVGHAGDFARSYVENVKEVCDSAGTVKVVKAMPNSG